MVIFDTSDSHRASAFISNFVLCKPIPGTCWPIALLNTHHPLMSQPIVAASTISLYRLAVLLLTSNDAVTVSRYRNEYVQCGNRMKRNWLRRSVFLRRGNGVENSVWKNQIRFTIGISSLVRWVPSVLCSYRWYFGWHTFVRASMMKQPWVRKIQ